MYTLDWSDLKKKKVKDKKKGNNFFFKFALLNLTIFDSISIYKNILVHLSLILKIYIILFNSLTKKKMLHKNVA